MRVTFYFDPPTSTLTFLHGRVVARQWMDSNHAPHFTFKLCVVGRTILRSEQDHSYLLGKLKVKYELMTIIVSEQYIDDQ